MGFVIAAAVLALVALAILSFPWWRPNRSRLTPTLSGEDLAAELGEDVATGMLAEEDLEPASRDLEATADAPDGGRERRGVRRQWSWAVLALLLVPAAAAVLYWHFGNWRVAFEGEQAATLHRAQSMLAELQTHQRRHPNDLQGWLNLGQGAEAMGRYSLAAKAFGKAVALKPQPDAGLLGKWGEAQLMADPRTPTARERRIFHRVLKLDPDNPRGLWYGGLLALNAGDRAEAVDDWQRLLRQPDVPSQVADLVRRHLTMLGAASTAAAPATTGGSGRLAVTVKVAPALAGKVSKGETLYVFVRSASGGPPLAVRRLAASGFPVTVRLSDSDAMMQGHGLSSASGPLVVVARVAPSGDAAPHPGDLVGRQRISAIDGHGVSVTIARRLGGG